MVVRVQQSVKSESRIQSKLLQVPNVDPRTAKQLMGVDVGRQKVDAANARRTNAFVDSTARRVRIV